MKHPADDKTRELPGHEYKIGYARVSTDDQNLDLQRDALRAVGCIKIYEDKMSGAKAARPGLTEALNHAREGDTLVVWRLDRLGRNMRDLIDLSGRLDAAGVQLESLHEHIDTSTATGKMYFQMLAVFAEFERNQTRERTNAGLKSARARGRTGGRPAISPETIADIRRLMADRNNSPSWICDKLKISRSTLYRYAQKNTEIASR